MSNYNQNNDQQRNLKRDADDLRHYAQDASESVKKTANNLTNKAKDAYEQVSDTVSNRYEDVSAKVKDTYNDVKGNIKDSYSKFKHQACDVEDEVVSYVKKNPVKAVGFAVIAGFLLSHFLTKK
jgi:ElaB/YqjD/DUF883 family membrane-anchored ribosome-binding protein